MEKLILSCPLSPGDVLALTAAIRDLHRSYPGKFLTDVRTPFPELWEYNPFISPLSPGDDLVVQIDCRYPLIDRSNSVPAHFLNGFVQYLSQRLSLNIELTEFRGDIHLSEIERCAPSPLAEIHGYDGPYWVIVSGGKQDFTIKWWDYARYQQVVDHFQGRLHFAQVGAAGHFHPELQGVFDLRARTNLRQLIRLVYHADGIVCPVTFLMHLAAAVPPRREHRLRPCVVVAGGREPPQWEAYPGHQFLHTIGMLACCRSGGCWRSRTKPLPDKSHLNSAEHLCVDVVDNLPRCMDLIKGADVIRKVEMYLEGAGHFERLFQTERLKMGVDFLPNQVGDFDGVPAHSTLSVRGMPSSEKELIIEHYRNVVPARKRPLLEDLSEHALTNIPKGLGDTILLTQLPWVARCQGKKRYIASKSVFFQPLIRLNPYYEPAQDRPCIAANVLQLRYDLGNGHIIQRLQRAFRLQPELAPRGYVGSPGSIQAGRIAFHFDARTSHAAWQRVYVHPRARQLYSESHRIIQQFVDSHPEMSFFQIGSTAKPFRNVEDRTRVSLDETIRLLRECEYFVGVVSGPMHLATALGVKCIVILNFPDANQIILPVLRDIDLIESEWLYPQNVHLHQETEGPLVKRLTLQNLEKAIHGEIYPYWSNECLPLIHEAI